MTDKERILAKIKSLLNETNYEPYTDEVLGRINLLKELKSYIDSLQEEPVSEEFEEALAREWQGYNDRGAATVDALEDNTQELAFAKGFYRAWNHPKQLAASEDLEEAAENAIPECMWGVDVNEDGIVEEGYDRNQMISMFKAGANWQKQQTLDSNALLYNARMEGMEIGKAEIMSKVKRYLDKVDINSDDYYDQIDDCYDNLCEMVRDKEG